MKTDKLTVVGALPWHIDYVCHHLRDQDLEEAKAGGWDGVQGLIRDLNVATRKGYAWAVLTPSGVPCVVGGVVPYQGNKVGSVWLLGTNDLTPHWREFARRSPAYVDALHTITPLLTNDIHTKNTVHLRWLKRVGFTFIEGSTFKASTGEDFIKFVRTRNV
jgi:hypothetical protein